MTKNGKQIVAGIRALTQQNDEIYSGKVVSGSVDEEKATLSVLLSEKTIPLTNVTIGSVKNGNCSVVLVPEDESEVIVGCVDGPGRWTLLKADSLLKAMVKVGETTCTIESSGIVISHGDTTIAASTLLKMSTSGENMHALLKDLITTIKAITVGTPSGASTTPVNIPAFDVLITRLDNLLEA